MGPSYPLSVFDDRQLPPDFDGNVFIWDIDKTYLSTHFSSMKGLARIPIEFAIDKEAIAGMPEVLRGLRRGPGPTFAAAPLYFISSSPPQLKPVISRKMLLDGVQPDGFTFKNWLKTIRQLRPKRLRDHLGYKLCALLHGRRSRPLAREFLFGDNVERDAETYSLYAALLSGELKRDALEGAMITGGVSPEDRLTVLELAEELPETIGSVGRIFIHLARSTPDDELQSFGSLVAPVRNACQLCLVLFEMGLIDQDAVIQATHAVSIALGRSRAKLEDTLEDAIARQLVKDDTLHRLGL